MIDANILLRRWLVEGLGTERVWTVSLPEYLPDTGEGFRPEDGPGIVISTRGGQSHTEIPIIRPSMQVTVWAGPNQQEEARELYNDVFALIHGRTNVDFDTDGYVLSCLEETHGQDEVDPDEGYARVVGFFNLFLRSN